MSESSAEALELHRDAVVVDLHADTLELVSLLGYDVGVEHRPWAAVGRVLGHVDVPRLRRGGSTAQFFGVVNPPWSTLRSAMAKVRRQCALLEQLCEEHDELLFAQTAADLLEAHRSDRIATFIGVEGAYGIVEDPATAEELSRLGVRYLGLAHLVSTRAAPSNLGRGRGGLDERGRALVAALEGASVLVDLAHLARPPFLEVCEAAARPLLVSHTGVSGVHPMWRNIDDEQIRAVARTGGVIGVIMTPRYLGRPGAEGIADHLEHLYRVGGEDLPALGSDFDGLVRPPADVGDAAGLPRITEALVARGLPEQVIRKMLGLNVVRLLEEVPPSTPREDGG